MKIGVLALQGSVAEHLSLLKKCGVFPVAVKYPEELENLSGLIIPGGESTAIGRLLSRYKFIDKIKKLAKEKKLAVYGTCAGLVLVSSRSAKGEVEPFKLDLINIEVIRNAFGRQCESFEAGLGVSGFNGKPFPAVFIRAPIISKAEETVTVLAKYEDKIVAARQDNILVTSFHPELTNDKRFHEYFITMAGGKINGC